MAGAKKKRKKVQQQSRKIPTIREETPNSYIKMYERIVRKHLQFLGLEPDLFDKLNKKTRLHMMFVKSTLPIFAIKEGYSVPKVYIKFLNQILMKYLQSNEYGYDNIGYTYEDYFLVGFNFDLNVKNFIENNIVPADQIERLRPALEAAQSPRIGELKIEMNQYLRLFMVTLLNIYSNINYRYYCYDIKFVGDFQTSRFSEYYYVYSQEGERKSFKIDNIHRTAMRVGVVLSGVPTRWVNFEKGKITNSKSKELLPVYLQSHALQRMKERINTSSAYRNLAFFYTFYKVDNTVLECDIYGRKILPVYGNDSVKIGYFPFTITDNCIVIKSFLPLTSPITTEGSKFHKALNIEKKDIVYWNMDKLRFYLETDLERIPILKKALEEADLWHLTMIEPIDEEYYLPPERKANPLLEKFFENYNPEETTEEEIENNTIEQIDNEITNLQ